MDCGEAGTTTGGCIWDTWPGRPGRGCPWLRESGCICRPWWVLTRMTRLCPALRLWISRQVGDAGDRRQEEKERAGGGGAEWIKFAALCSTITMRPPRSGPGRGAVRPAGCLSDLVVVDNRSSDDSWERLAVLKSRRANERALPQDGEREEKRACGPAVHLHAHRAQRRLRGRGTRRESTTPWRNLVAGLISSIATPDIHVSDALHSPGKGGA